MASGVVGLASAGGMFVGVPYVGWAVGLAAAYIDQTVVYPALSGDPEEARQPQLASLPVSEQGVGAPRTFSLGARVRAPAHIMYQSEKVRESTSGGGKGGTSVSVKRVYVDALIHLNDRPTKRLLQLIGNGQLILYSERNLLGITTENMTAVVDGANVTFELGSPLDGDFETVFKKFDLVVPSGMVRVSGSQTFNNTFFQVESITPPVASAGGTMTVIPADGQDVTSLSYTGGTPFSPSSIMRSDSAAGGTEAQVWEEESIVPYSVEPTFTFHMRQEKAGSLHPAQVFQTGDVVRVRNTERWGAAGALCRINDMGGPGTGLGSPGSIHLDILDFNTVGVPMNQWGGFNCDINGEYCDYYRWGYYFVPTVQLGSLYNNSLRVWALNPFGPGTPFIMEHAEGTAFAPEVFPQHFDPIANFQSGDEYQGEPPVLVANFGHNESSSYRGMATQGLDECFVSVFGDQLPTNLEAIIEIDDQMSWAQALEALLQRGDLLNTQIDTSLVTPRMFRGFTVRGSAPVIQQMQPVLVAGQILTQNRGGVIALFSVDDADSVQIENGATFSDFGTRMYGEEAPHDKVQMVDASESDMPTSVGIRFQDPDQYYTGGYEHFGLRNPAGSSHTNEQTVDLSSLVLTRRESKDLATTIMRRAWVNRRKYRMTLPSAYLHLLENDLITWTDDEGEDITARIIQRDIGANFLINVTALREMTNLAVVGSPVQSSAQVIQQNVSSGVTVVTVAIDAPAIANGETTTPAVRLAIADMGGNLQTATVWESQAASSYQPIGTVGGTCALGYIISTLSAQTASEVFGTTVVSLRAQTCLVSWQNVGSGVIESCTQAQAEAGQNWCSIVDQGSPEAEPEIAAFTTVTDAGGGVYQLGGWLRGLRGTPSVARSNNTLVLLNQSTAGIFLREFAGPTPTSLAYKVVPSGGNLATTPVTTVSSPKFRNVLPLPIRNVTKTYNATTLSTRFDVAEHWERQLLPLGTQPPHTLDEPFEAYRVYIYQDGQTIVADSYVLDSRLTGATTLRDTYFDWSNSRAVAAGYTPGPSETYQIGYQQIGRWGDGPLRLETI